MVSLKSLFEFQGLSMAPWLMPGDIVVLSPKVLQENIRLGDVIVIENESGQRICHRVVKMESTPTSPFPFVLKGDRVPYCDDVQGHWKFVGKVLERIRDDHRSFISTHRIFVWMSLWGLYPGQTIPKYFSRTSLKALFCRE